MRWHGQSAEANPSGGNNFRGIYNIRLKSLGAAKKKPADAPRRVLEYASKCSVESMLLVAAPHLAMLARIQAYWDLAPTISWTHLAMT